MWLGHRGIGLNLMNLIHCKPIKLVKPRQPRWIKPNTEKVFDIMYYCQRNTLHSFYFIKVKNDKYNILIFLGVGIRFHYSQIFSSKKTLDNIDSSYISSPSQASES